MTETKNAWTPGEWTIEDPMGPENLWIVEAGKPTYEWRCIAMVPNDDGEEDDGHPRISAKMQRANARLLANAKKLYEALADIIGDRTISGLYRIESYQIDRARAALRAARGEG